MENEIKKIFIGKKIKDFYVDGFCINLLLEDNTEFIYNATDGGYSDWQIKNNKGENNNG